METIIIEQTRAYKNRVVYDPRTRTFVESEYLCLFHERGFIYPYGWLKGYGTPPDMHLDAFLMSEGEYVLGEELPARVVGVFIRNDGDHKLVCVSPGRVEQELWELPQTQQMALRNLYPVLHPGEGWFGKDRAAQVMRDFLGGGEVVTSCPPVRIKNL